MAKTTDRKQVPLREREAIAAALQDLLNQRDAAGRKVHSQHAIGVMLGVSQESARRALVPEGVGPAIRDAAPRALGMSIEEIVRKFGSRVTKLESVKRYANREQAIEHLVEDGAGTLAEVRAAADAYAVALKSDSDLTVLEWARQIEGKIRELRRGGPKIADVPVTSIGDEDIGDTFRGIVDRKKKAVRPLGKETEK